MTRPDDDSPGTAAGDARTPEILVPGLRLIATQLSDVPQHTMEALEGWVEPIVDGQTVTDWRLNTAGRNSDDIELIELFELWRRRWSVSTPLETVFNVSRLYTLVDELRPPSLGSVWTRAVGHVLSTGEPRTIPSEDLEALGADCEALGDTVRERGATAIGIVDTSPPPAGLDVADLPPRRGLAAGWALGSDDRLVAADHAMSVIATTTRRLVVHRHQRPGSAPAPDDLDVAEVEVREGSLCVTDADPGRHTVEIPLASARPLSWLVPGATTWRVREVPEALIWAKSLVTLPELAEEARALGRTIRLSLDDAGGPLSASGSWT